MIIMYTTSSLDGNGSGNILLIISGALALTAMLLPGISGALVLLTLGQYTVVASSFHDLDFISLSYFLLGGLIGLLSFVPLMSYAMNNFLDYTMSLLAGLMCGSLITLWPWKEDYEAEGLSPNLGLSQVFESFAFFSIILSILFLVLGGYSSFILKNFENKVES